MHDLDLLQDFQEKLDIQLPTTLVELLTSEQELDYYDLPTVEEFVNFDWLTGDLPSRMIPALRQPSGDLVAAYYPHSGASPLVVFFALEESRVIPQSANAVHYFANVDEYAPDHPDNDDEVRQDSPDGWNGLIFNPPSGFAPGELLKPFFLNTSLEAEQDMEVFNPLARVLSGATGASDRISQIITEVFGSAGDLLDSVRWMNLAKEFEQRSMWSEAIQACENCETSLNIYPFYGFPSQQQAKPDWAQRYAVLEYLHELVAGHGDAFSRVTVTKKLDIVTRNMRM